MHISQPPKHPPPSVVTAPYFIVFLFFVRCLDVFVIRSDEWFGEQVLTKLVGIIAIFAYLWLYQLPFRRLGLTRVRLWESICWGTAIILLALFAGYTGEWLFLFFNGQNPTFYINPQGNSLGSVPNTIGIRTTVLVIVFLTITLLLGKYRQKRTTEPCN